MVSDLFHSPHRRSFHLSLTVLVHYRFLLVFSLTPWSAQIPTEFLVLRGTQVPIRSLFGFAYKTFTFYGGPFPGPFATKKFCNSSPLKVVGSYNPRASSGLGYSPFVRHYLGNRMFLYFPPLTEMFQFRKFPPHRLCIGRRVPDKIGRVAPFGNLRFVACCQLPEAYRRLPRPSSAKRTKASTKCFSLILTYQIAKSQKGLLLPEDFYPVFKVLPAKRE